KLETVELLGTRNPRTHQINYAVQKLQYIPRTERILGLARPRASSQLLIHSDQEIDVQMNKTLFRSESQTLQLCENRDRPTFEPRQKAAMFCPIRRNYHEVRVYISHIPQ